MAQQNIHSLVGKRADGKLHLLTASRLKAFRACPRLEQIKYRELVMPLKSRPPLKFGTLVHLGLEIFWTAIKNKDSHGLAAEKALDAMFMHALDDAFEQARAVAMMTGYCAVWREFATQIEVLAVEVQFRAPLVNPDDISKVAKTWERGGKIDVMIRMPNSMIAIMEHKTSGVDTNPGSAYRGALAMDGQISMYFHGAAALGYKARLCLYDVLRKPKVKPLKATPVEKRKTKKNGDAYAKQRTTDETVAEYQDRVLAKIAAKPEEFYSHIEVGRTDEELARDARDAWHTVAAMTQMSEKKYFPRNPDACFRFGAPCEYLGVCQGVEDLNDPMKFRRLSEPHPELQEETEKEDDDGEDEEAA